MRGKLLSVVVATLVSWVVSLIATGQEPPPGFNTKIPAAILTPDRVETRIGTLEFFDGIPTAATAALLSGAVDVEGRAVAVVVSGGNLDPSLLAGLA